MDLLNMYL